MAEMQDYATNLLKALKFAADMHRDQRRKGIEASPYINHPIQVAEVLSSIGSVSDLPTLMAAILHDTIEDTEATIEDLDRLFSAEVASLVSEVTDDKSLPKAARKANQIAHAPQLSDRAKMIKIADKICNVRDIGSKPPVDWNEQRRSQYFDWASEVVEGCKGVNAGLEDYFSRCLEESRTLLVTSNA